MLLEFNGNNPKIEIFDPSFLSDLYFYFHKSYNLLNCQNYKVVSNKMIETKGYFYFEHLNPKYNMRKRRSTITESNLWTFNK